MEEPLDNSTRKNSESLSPHTGAGIVIDIGTGDGRFVYESAREDPHRFFIGIDANPSALRKVSEKIYRKAEKGGAPNVLFLQAAVEDLPEELNHVADEVHIHFPWGSLLQAVANGEADVLRNLRRICADGASLEVIIGLDPERDQSEIDRLGLPNLSEEYLRTELVPKYLQAGFEIEEAGVLPAIRWRELKSSWAKRLATNTARVLVYFIAHAV